MANQPAISRESLRRGFTWFGFWNCNNYSCLSFFAFSTGAQDLGVFRYHCILCSSSADDLLFVSLDDRYSVQWSLSCRAFERGKRPSFPAKIPAHYSYGVV